MNHYILELYSGIGGMHCAWKDSNLPGKVAGAIDINEVANKVYKHNFPDTALFVRNIQAVKVNEIQKLNVDTILMSPPCQPFSRNGKYLDDKDPRTKSFLYIIDILDQLDSVNYILMENVKGFEHSTVRDLFVEKLKKCNFNYQEFLLCPTSMGIPNSRLRYYCLAKRDKFQWNLCGSEQFIEKIYSDTSKPMPSIQDIIEHHSNEHLVPENFLKKAHLLDICHRQSQRSCCFTKAYTHYIEGAGSVYTEATPERIEECFRSANDHAVGSDDYVKCIIPLKLRFFTPKEVAAIMQFPEWFTFPTDVTKRQHYRLLGNSVNVKVVSELLKLLFNELLL